MLLKQPRPDAALDRVYGFHVQAGTLDELLASLAPEKLRDGVESGAAAMMLRPPSHSGSLTRSTTSSDNKLPHDAKFRPPAFVKPSRTETADDFRSTEIEDAVFGDLETQWNEPGEGIELLMS